MKENFDNDELYCASRLGIKNAKGKLARDLRELSVPVSFEEISLRPLSRARFLVVDLETTGGKPGSSSIIEIGAVEVDGFSLGREFASLIGPGVCVPRFISEMTGIRGQMLEGAPKLEKVLPLLEDMLRGRILVAHNLRFDYSFLQEAWKMKLGRELDVPALCTVKLSRRVFPELSSHNLDSVASHLGIRPETKGIKSRHRALGDARITARALMKICRRLEEEGMADVSELIVFESSRRRKTMPSRISR